MVTKSTGDEKRQRQKEIVTSLDVGQRNKDCRDRQNQQQDREVESIRVQNNKTDKAKNEDVKRGNARKKRGENLSVSLSPRLGHSQSAPSFCRILSPTTVLLAPTLLWSLKAPPLPALSSLTHSLTLPICCSHERETNRICVNHCGALGSRPRPLSHGQVSGDRDTNTGLHFTRRNIYNK